MDNYTRTLRNTFVSDNIDRLHHRRTDADWLEAALMSDRARFILMVKDSVYTTKHPYPKPIYLDAGSVSNLTPQANAQVFLGDVQQHSYFALAFEELPEFKLNGGRFSDLREIALNLDPEEGAIIAQAKGMAVWHRQNNFCSMCGHPTNSTEAGYIRMCSNLDCKHLHFPRTDPAIIVRVTYDNKCLLGRQTWWPKGRYSNIAGFVEPGESLETAVVREVWEETGIRLDTVNYHSSQPWPFPRSLMLGFTAVASSVVIKRNDGELEDACWFTREQIFNGLVEGKISMPSAYSISFHLIEDWFNEGTFGKLNELVN
jgi:NAD+ diphosphatase